MHDSDPIASPRSTAGRPLDGTLDGTLDRNVPAGVSLIVGSALGLLTMALHPDGSQLLRDLETYGPRTVLAHGLAIAGLPLSLFGPVAFSARLRVVGAPALGQLALLVYAAASIAAFNAAVASGFVSPMIAERYLALTGPEAELWLSLFRFNGMVNQGFAGIWVFGMGGAMLLWSLAAWRTRLLARSIAGVGLIVGGALVLFIGSGRTHLDVHTVGLIVLGQSVWMIAVALQCLAGGPRRPEE